MTNSYRHTPIFSMASPKAGQVRKYKDYRWGRERMRTRTAIATEQYDDAERLTHWNEWDCPRDGKHYWAQATEKDMRK